MANIKVKIGYPIKTGVGFTFHAPCDCTEITGLTVVHPGGTDKFTFVDAHGNILSDINHLFAAGSLVKVVLDCTKYSAAIQNADTNAYLEQRLDEASVSVRDQNTDAPVRFWIGTEEEYQRTKDSLPADTLCITTDGVEVIPNMGAYNSNQDLTDALNELLGDLPDGGMVRRRFAVLDMPSATATWVAEITKTSDGYGMLTAKSLYTGTGITYAEAYATAHNQWTPLTIKGV